jgi:hypothetical protein
LLSSKDKRVYDADNTQIGTIYNYYAGDKNFAEKQYFTRSIQ